MSAEEPAPSLPSRGPAEWLNDVRRLEGEGELFHAYDVARQAIQQFPEDIALKHRAVLCLASTGAWRTAIKQFEAFGLAPAGEGDGAGFSSRLAMDLAALDARLRKDRALAAAPEERRSRLIAAADAYQSAYRRAQRAGYSEAYYPGINCATLRLLAGDQSAAAGIAREILDQLASWPAERKGYFEVASELEALLIVGETDRARQHARLLRDIARRRQRPDFRDLASTIGQLRRVVEALKIDFNVAAALAPPKVIHYVGHIIAAPGERGRFAAEEEDLVARRIAETLDAGPVGFAFGSLAAGADILFAEALLERGVSLHVVLPFNLDEFVEASVRPAGANWIDRFHTCYKRATTTLFATDGPYLKDDSLFGYCSQLAMGLAVLRADHLCAEVEQIAVWDAGPSPGAAGTAADVTIWQKAPDRRQTIIPIGNRKPGATKAQARRFTTARRTRAMLFGDVRGFSRLNDDELPRFVKVVLGGFARVLDRFKRDIRLKNTWGDGLFVVFDDAGTAADCALALRDAMSDIDLAAARLPGHLALRLGGHLGPVYSTTDPILKRQNFFGAHVSRASRIEPVAPPNLVYVTEPFAAVLALHNAEAFSCHYVGMTETAKEYGQLPMFLLERK